MLHFKYLGSLCDTAADIPLIAEIAMELEIIFQLIRVHQFQFQINAR